LLKIQEANSSGLAHRNFILINEYRAWKRQKEGRSGASEQNSVPSQQELETDQKGIALQLSQSYRAAPRRLLPFPTKASARNATQSSSGRRSIASTSP
jgi:hypothetical protein